MKTNAQQLAKISRYGRQRRHKKPKPKKVKRQQAWTTYAGYLQTDHWQYLKQRMLTRAKYTCEFCGSKSRLEVHHRTYDRLGHEWLTDLVVVCRNCHERIHEVHKRNPDLSLTEATNLARRRTVS